jgi:hypothetical protein
MVNRMPMVQLLQEVIKTEIVVWGGLEKMEAEQICKKIINGKKSLKNKL